MTAANRTRLITLAVLMLILLSAVLQASPQAAGPAGASLTGITISFKLDPRLSGPTYGGERWVSPPVYTGANAQDTVETKAAGVGARGEPVRISPQWIQSDPEMVTVSPSQGDQVKITVKRAGESELQVTAQGVSKELAVKAEYKGKVLQVQITQLPKAKPAEAAIKPEAQAPRTQAPPKFKSQKEKLSYALGMNLANALQKKTVEVDEGLLFQGFKDASSGVETLMTAQEVRATLAAVQNELKSKQAAAELEKQKGLAEKNRESGEAFLAENKKKDGVVSLPSGLQYKVLKEGDGKKPMAGDAVVCNYRGTLIDGTEFDSSYKRKRPATFAVTGVIKGWSEALQLMPVGSKWQLFIPSDLAYGERGARRGSIGPNATLIFEVELLSIKNSLSATDVRTAQEQDAVSEDEELSHADNRPVQASSTNP